MRFGTLSGNTGYFATYGCVRQGLAFFFSIILFFCVVILKGFSFRFNPQRNGQRVDGYIFIFLRLGGNNDLKKWP